MEALNLPVIDFSLLWHLKLAQKYVINTNEIVWEVTFQLKIPGAGICLKS